MHIYCCVYMCTLYIFQEDPATLIPKEPKSLQKHVQTKQVFLLLEMTDLSNVFNPGSTPVHFETKSCLLAYSYQQNDSYI